MEITEDNQKKFRIIIHETMKKFISLCEENNLKYYAAYGTCLGAIRHHGMIPWDDDIDVIMPRCDYEKFISLKTKLNGTEYEIRDYTDAYYYLPFAKFMNSKTTIYEVEKYQFVLGVFIDIFPLDEVDDINYSRCLSDMKKRIFAEYVDTFTHLKFNDYIKNLLRFKIKILGRHLLCCFFKKQLMNYYKNKYEKIESRIKAIHGNLCVYYGGSYSFEKELCNKDWFGEGIKVPFESYSIIVPKEYDIYLKNLYDNYLAPPPEEKRRSNHFLYFADYEKRWKIEDIFNLNYEKQR